MVYGLFNNYKYTIVIDIYFSVRRLIIDLSGTIILKQDYFKNSVSIDSM